MIAEKQANEYFHFRLGRHRLALPLEIVKEVIPRIRWEVLPNQPDVVLGIINFHGEPVALLDTTKLLGAEFDPGLTDKEGRDNLEAEAYIVILETRQGAMALFLNGLDGIAPLSFAGKDAGFILPKEFPVDKSLIQTIAYEGVEPIYAIDPHRAFSPEQMQRLVEQWNAGRQADSAIDGKRG